MRLHLVRHGLTLVDPSVPPSRWELDPVGFDDVWALRESDALPRGATWFCSPEPKAVATAQLLTESEVGILASLREHERSAWTDGFETLLARAFADPDTAAYAGWETVASCRERLLRTVAGIRSAHAGEDVVLVGHGTAWTILAAALGGVEPDLDRWRALPMPGLIRLELDEGPDQSWTQS